MRSILCTAVLAGSLIAPAAAQLGGVCIPDLGNQSFAFAGDIVNQPAANCSPGSMLLASSLEVIPDPPMSDVEPTDAFWNTLPGDEGDYLMRRTYTCEGVGQQVSERPVSLVSRLTLVGLELSQGVADAELGGVAGRNLIPGRRTLLRLFVEYDEGDRPSVTYTARLRGFAVDFSGPTPQCLGELAHSPRRPLNAAGAHVAAPGALARRSSLKSSLNFEIPLSWVAPNTFLLIESEDGHPLFSVLGSNFPAFGTANLGVTPSRPPNPDGTPGDNLDLVLLAIPWEDAQSVNHVADVPLLRDIVRRLRGGLPFRDLDVTAGFLPIQGLSLPPAPTENDVFLLIRTGLRLVELFRAYDYPLTAKGSTPFPAAYHGVIVDRPANIFGYGLARTAIASVAFDLPQLPTTHLHEIGHVLGLEHTSHSQFGTGGHCRSPCPAGFVAGPCCSCTAVDDATNFPNISAVGNTTVATLYDIGSGFGPREVFGLDLYPRGGRNPRPLSPFLYYEAMSYCDASWGGQGQWLSDLNWQIITSGLELLKEDIPALAATPSRVRIYTGASDGVNVELSPVFEVDTLVPPGLDTMGEFTFREKDGVGTILREGKFDVTPLITEGPAATQDFTFGVFVPHDPAVRRAEFLQGTTLIDAIDASPNPPTVTVTFPNGGEVVPVGPVTITWTSNDPDGDPLLHWVQLSVDDGANWRTLALGIAGNGLNVDTSLLPSGNQARIRVVVSDGFWNAEDTSDAVLEIIDDDPVLELVSPPDGVHVAEDQGLTLEARADDANDGPLRDDSIDWDSDIDGALGSGETVTLRASDLSIGSHVITATATDDNGNMAQEQVTVNIETFSLPGAMAPARPDLELEAVLPSPPQRVAQTTSILWIVRNWGRDPAADVVLQAAFPPLLGVTSATPSTGTCMTTAVSIDCDLGTLDPRDEITVMVDTSGLLEGADAISAFVTTTDLDVDPSDNLLQSTVSVRAAADPDMDGDGFSAAAGDCDDNDAGRSPAVGELCNGIDDNCNGSTDESGDSLCFSASACTVGVCDPVMGCVISAGATDVDGDTFVAAECGGTDCDDNDIDLWAPPETVTGFVLVQAGGTQLSWDNQGPQVGPVTGYEVLSGSIDPAIGFVWNATCLATVPSADYLDLRADPPSGHVDWFLIRSINGCGLGNPGTPEREAQLPACP